MTLTDTINDREYSSAKTMDSLRSLASPSANVVRDGHTVVVPSAEVVPGDLVELKTGEKTLSYQTNYFIPTIGKVMLSQQTFDLLIL